MKKENTWKQYSPEQLKELEELSLRYRAFLDAGKTERECVKETVRIAREHGYQDLSEVMKEGRTLSAGDKVYVVFMEKAVALLHIGTRMLR